MKWTSIMMAIAHPVLAPFPRQHTLCAPIVMPAQAGTQEVGVKTRQDALDSRVKPGNDKLEWGFLVVLSSIQPRRWPAGLDYEKDKTNRNNALDRIGVELQAARLIDQETSTWLSIK